MLKYVAAAGIVLGCTIGANAADLIVDQGPVDPVDTSFVDSQIYVQLVGGVALGNELTYYFDGNVDTTYDMDAGYALGGAIGVNVWEGLSVEADVFHTRRNYAGSDPYGEWSTSLMGNLKYTFALNDTFGVYVAGGLGYVWLAEGDDYDAQFTYSGPGYQVIAGATAKFTDSLTGLVEVRYQDTFGPAEWTDGDNDDMGAPTTSVLVGLKYGF